VKTWDSMSPNGKRHQLKDNIQERYGIAKDQARKDVDDWYKARTPRSTVTILFRFIVYSARNQILLTPFTDCG